MTTEEALEILGLTATASQGDIKEAYRDLAKVWHPDRFPDDARLRDKAQEKLKAVNEAYRASALARVEPVLLVKIDPCVGSGCESEFAAAIGTGLDR